MTGRASLAAVAEETRLAPGFASRTPYGAELAECRERLQSLGARCGGPPLASLAGAGKLLRASLVLAVGSPLVAAPAALLPATVSIELLHLASLLHDDIIDGATERRGAPAVHVAAGTDRALVLGDMLIAAAFEVAEEIGEHAGSNAFAGAVAALSRGTQRCCLGQ